MSESEIHEEGIRELRKEVGRLKRRVDSLEQQQRHRSNLRLLRWKLLGVILASVLLLSLIRTFVGTP